MTIGKLSSAAFTTPIVVADDVSTDAETSAELLQEVLGSGYDPSTGQPATNLGPRVYLPAPQTARYGANAQRQSGAPSFDQRVRQPGGFAGTTGNARISEQLPATSLHDEVLGDGQANCLERAVGLCGPDDSVVLLDDQRDDSGHAVVRHADGSITDPNDPSRKYASIADYRRQNPQYFNPITVNGKALKSVLALPPGAERDALISKLGLDEAAARRVADSGNEPVDLANAIANAPTYSPTEMALLSKIKDPEQRAIQELQMQMQKQALLCTVLTNLAQMRHDMLKAVAQNLRS